MTRNADYAVVAKVVKRRVQYSIKSEESSFTVKLVFVAASIWHFNYRVDFTRRIRTAWKVSPQIEHFGNSYFHLVTFDSHI